MSDSSNPFASPQSSTSLSPPRQDLVSPRQPTPKWLPYKSAMPRAWVVVVLLSIWILLQLASIWSSIMQVQLLERAQAGEQISPAEIRANDEREIFIAFASLGVYLPTGILFLMWFHRVHYNLPSLGATKLKYSPGWAVGYFLIPILNLFRPVQVMCEVWANSDPNVIRLAEPSKTGSVSPLVGIWWAAWLTFIISERILSRFLRVAKDIDEVIVLTWAAVGLSGISVIAAVLAIQVVQCVTHNQQQRHHLIAENKDPDDTPRSSISGIRYSQPRKL